ncbi:hypothetical protein ABIB83_008059, partial [Bradyrhizobium sp. I1.8.5]
YPPPGPPAVGAPPTRGGSGGGRAGPLGHFAKWAGTTAEDDALAERF